MNKAFIVGNLTKDPQFSITNSGVSVCNFSVATNRKFKTKDGEQISDFHQIIAWRGLADICAKYLAKGRKVAVAGDIQTRKYVDKNEITRYVTEILADDIEFLTPKSKTEQSTEMAEQDQNDLTDIPPLPDEEPPEANE